MSVSHVRWSLMVGALALLAASADLSQAGSGPGGGGELRAKTRLAGAAIGGVVPSGHADYRERGNSRRLNVEVEDVKLAVGSLDVFVNADRVGAIMMAPCVPGSPLLCGELELNTNDGEVVPDLAGNETVTVKNGAASILAGAL